MPVHPLQRKYCCRCLFRPMFQSSCMACQQVMFLGQQVSTSSTCQKMPFLLLKWMTPLESCILLLVYQIQQTFFVVIKQYIIFIILTNCNSVALNIPSAVCLSSLSNRNGTCQTLNALLPPGNCYSTSYACARCRAIYLYEHTQRDGTHVSGVIQCLSFCAWLLP